MVKTLVLALGLALSIHAKALTIDGLVTEMNRAILSDVQMQSPFNWVVGDTASYDLKMGFLPGKMVMTVKAVSATALVINQELDLTIQKQSCDITMNPQTGKTESMVCNGQAQNPGEQTVEVIESKEDTVKVPAGSFTCLYIKAKATTNGQESVIEQWVNPKEVPVMGMVKSVVPSQLGQVVIELTSFKKM